MDIVKKKLFEVKEFKRAKAENSIDAPQTSPMGRLRDTVRSRNKRLGKIDVRSQHPMDSKSSTPEERSRVASRSLFKMVQANPANFKSGSISISRKKMRKLAGLDPNEELNFDRLNPGQRAGLEKVFAEKYTSEEMKLIYDICLNYKDRVNGPSKSGLHFNKTKEMVYKSIEQFERKIDRASHSRPEFLLRKHRSTASIHSSSLLSISSKLNTQPELASTIKQHRDSVMSKKVQTIISSFTQHLSNADKTRSSRLLETAASSAVGKPPSDKPYQLFAANRFLG